MAEQKRSENEQGEQGRTPTTGKESRTGDPGRTPGKAEGDEKDMDDSVRADDNKPLH